MRKIVQIFTYSLLAFLMMIHLTCCSSSVSPEPWPLPVELDTVALPYVEAVHFPAEIHAGQPFTVTVDISCDANPALLHSPAHPRAYDHYSCRQNTVVMGEVIDEYFTVFSPVRDPSLVDPSLSQANSVAYTFNALPAGMHFLSYYSAPSATQGGMDFEVYKNGCFPFVCPEGTYMTIPFTVLP